MTELSQREIWIIIAAMGVGTYLIRLSFIGLVGNRKMPAWVLRMLRFTPVAVLPAVVTPMLVGQNSGETDPVKLLAALATVIVGVWTRNVLYAILTGMGLFYALGGLAKTIW